MPLSSSALLNRDEVLDLIEDLKSSLPDEIKQARWVVKDREELLANFSARTPAGPVLTTDNVADAVYLLCLPEAAMINGHTLVVDGGFSISG